MMPAGLRPMRHMACAAALLVSGCGGAASYISEGRLTDAEASCQDLDGDEKSDCYDMVANAYRQGGELEGAERCCRGQSPNGTAACLKDIAKAHEDKKQPLKAAEIYEEIGEFESAARTYQNAGNSEEATRAWAQALLTSALECVEDHALSKEECEAKIEGMAGTIGGSESLCDVAKSAARLSYEKGACVTLGTIAREDADKDERMNQVQSSKKYRLVGDRLRDYVKRQCPAVP